MNDPATAFDTADHERPRVLLTDFAVPPLRPVEAKILWALIAAGGFVSHCRLSDFLWGDDPDGGPLDIRGTREAHICGLRKKLLPGVRIKNVWGQGHALEVFDSTTRVTDMNAQPRLRTMDAPRRGSGMPGLRPVSTTAQAAALADRLEACVTKRALAEALADHAVVAAVIDRRSPAQVEADLLVKLRRYEQVVALRRFGRKGRGR